MHGNRNFKIIFFEAFVECVKIIINRKSIPGTEAHKMIGIKMSRKCFGRIKLPHMFTHMLEQPVSDLIAVQAVYILEPVYIIPLYAIFFTRVVFYPLLHMLMKP